MKSIKASLLLLLLASCHAVSYYAEEEEEVQISKKCGAVLLASTTALGAGAVYALTPAAICTAGFCPVGVTGGSFASWWQATMPLIAVGTNFAKLQALAMAGKGIGSITLGGATVGGATGVYFLKSICAFVDDTDPESVTGIAMDASVRAVTGALQMKESLANKCAASETCSAMSEMGSSTVMRFTKALAFNDAKDALLMTKEEAAAKAFGSAIDEMRATAFELAAVAAAVERKELRCALASPDACASATEEIVTGVAKMFPLLADMKRNLAKCTSSEACAWPAEEMQAEAAEILANAAKRKSTLASIRQQKVDL